MKPKCEPRRVIKHNPPKSETRYSDGDTGDIIETIFLADAGSAAYIDLDGVQCLVGDNDRDTLRNVWAFVKYNLNYRPDRRGHEQVKKPGPLFYTGVGDCKSFSIATGAILRALGFKYKYRFTAYAPGDVTHVYIVARTANGKQVIMDSVYQEFDKEQTYFSKMDIGPDEMTEAGIGGINFDFSNLILAGLAGIFIWYLFKPQHD